MVHIIDKNITPNAIIVDIFLPFVSEIKFIIMRPKNDPIEKTDWIVSLAHYL